MKLPDSLLNGMENGKHGRGVTPFALLLIALAAIGGVFFGLSFMPRETIAGQNCSPQTSPPGTPVVTPVPAPEKTPPAVVRHDCGARCGMG